MPESKEVSRCEDTYFIDRYRAFRVAQQRNRVTLPSGDEAVQICYYDGDPLPHGPENLICAPLTKLHEFFLTTTLRLPTRLDIEGLELDEETLADLHESFTDALEEIRDEREENWEDDLETLKRDTYFFDPAVAYQIALQGNRTATWHRSTDGLQLCYYNGTPWDDGPANLVHLPADQILDFLSRTRLRHPKNIWVPPYAAEEEHQHLESAFKEVIGAVTHSSLELLVEATKEAAQLVPDFEADQPFRVIFPASRYTEVMQHTSRDLAKAFEALGCETMLSIEANDMEELNGLHYVEDYLRFRPHLTMNVNYLRTRHIHPSGFSASWWQDPMPILTQGDPLPWRERDIVLSFYPQFDDMLRRTGASRIHRQPACIDHAIFHPDYGIPRADKVIFVGSSYANAVADCTADVLRALDELTERFTAGEPLTEELIQGYAERLGVTFIYLWQERLNYVVRDTSVRWLCQAEGIEVEVYGYGWEKDPIVRPFSKGTIRHGKELARAYNGASHALVCLPHEINSQRLAEVSGCGCIPIVYDCRYHAEKPHWDDECLFYRTREQLHAALRAAPAGDPGRIAADLTYERMARRILGSIAAQVERPGPFLGRFLGQGYDD